MKKWKQYLHIQPWENKKARLGPRFLGAND